MHRVSIISTVLVLTRLEQPIGAATDDEAAAAACKGQRSNRTRMAGAGCQAGA